MPVRAPTEGEIDNHKTGPNPTERSDRDTVMQAFVKALTGRQRRPKGGMNPSSLARAAGRPT
jgi:hypothetical protein